MSGTLSRIEGEVLDAVSLQLWHQAYALLEEGESIEALEILFQLYDNGVLGVSSAIAWIFDRGHGNIAQNSKLAERWYRSAADCGGDEAKFDLSRFIIRSGDRAERTEALILLEELVKDKYFKANIYLGCAHLDGEYVPKNQDLAERYLFDAAREGYVSGMFFLSIIFKDRRAYLKMLLYRAKSAIWFLYLYFKNKEDDRLFLAFGVYGVNES